MNLINSTADLVTFLGTCIPEKTEAFNSLISELGITFLLDETTATTVFKADSKSKLILVGQKGVERLWAHAYGYASAFLATAWKKAQGDVPFDTEGMAILEEASQLLTWSVRTDMALRAGEATTVEDIPSGLPSPLETSDDGTVFSLAQSLWCNSLCFILLHELSHIQLSHRRQVGAANVEQEKDADREAARWLLDGTEGTERRQLERRLGVATALMYLATADVYLPGATGADYPPGYDRLFQTLSQYFFEDDAEESEQVWCFVEIGLMLHIHNKKIPFDPHRLKGSWRQIVSTLIDVLANRRTN